MKKALAEFAARSGRKIDIFDNVSSTNDVLRGNGYAHGSVVIAESQSAGRGQRGNSWSSQPNMNLTFSLLVHPRALRADKQFYISKTVSLAMCGTLAGFGITAVVKWPNDIYIGDRKAAGILIENDLSGTNISASIIGIGLNVNQTEFEPALPNPASMASATGATFDRAEVLKAFLEEFERHYGVLSAKETGTIDREYMRRVYRLGEEHTYALGAGGSRFKGTIIDIEPSGELVVRHSDGHLGRYLFKEIEYIL